MAVKSSSNIGRAVRSMRLRCSSSSSNDLEELGLHPLLLHKRATRRRRSDPLLLDEEFTSSSNNNNILACVGLSSSNKRAKNLVTLLVGEEQRAFRVEPQILDHGVVQCLLEKKGSPISEDEDEDDDKGCFNATNDGHRRRARRRAQRNKASTSSSSSLGLISLSSSCSTSSSSSSSSSAASKRVRIRVHCDAILFEHILWLLSNDDPSLRYLNVDELMEFYA